MIFQEADLELDFTQANNAEKFDDNSHGLSYCMKAIDFIVELPTDYLFIEVKDPSHPNATPTSTADFNNRTAGGALRDDLVRKFRDSFVYHWSEGKPEKPIRYLILITLLDEALLLNFQDDLKRYLPLAGPPRWTRKIASECIVVNENGWNRNFAQWPVRRLSSTP